MTITYPYYLSQEQEATLLKEFIDEDTGEIMYPESDGNPMSESTVHFQWITTLQGGLDSLFADKTDVFVAGDLLWYPVEGKPYLRVAPDIMVAFGRPKGERGSYEQWKEDNIAPQVVMEILSKGNDTSEMLDKFLFYEKYGVKEYYIYDYRKNKFYTWFRDDTLNRLITQLVMPEITSPLLGIKFDVFDNELRVFNPDNTPFLTYLQQDQFRKDAVKRAEQAKQEAEYQRLAKEQAKQEAEDQRLAKENVLHELEQLKALLKDKGYNLS
jgi:Uma2 family endonuclease